MKDCLRKLTIFVIAFAMVFTSSFFAGSTVYAEDEFSFYNELSVGLTDAIYDYLDEIYIEKYPEMALRFKYGTEGEKQELKALADMITEGKTTDMEKAMEISRWVKANITYGSGSPYPIDTFRNRTGVCLNYTLLASQLMRLVGIPSVVVDGHRGHLKTATKAELRNSGHAWLYAHIDGEWYMFDPLWLGGKAVTDREYLATYYLINSIEGIFITFDGMDFYNVNFFSSGARGYGPVYYNGIFKYTFNGAIDGVYYKPDDLGNSNLAINGINQNVTIRQIQDGGIQDGYYYLGDTDNERRNQMVAGQIYTDGWLRSGSSLIYLNENGVGATATVRKVGDKYLHLDSTVWEVKADQADYWTENGKLVFRTGTEGKILELYQDGLDIPKDQYTYSYSLYEDYGDENITVTEDGYLNLKKQGTYEIVLQIIDPSTGKRQAYYTKTVYVMDSKPEVDYTTRTIDISDTSIQLSEYDFMYTGEEIRPEVTVYETAFSVSGEHSELIEGEDYTVEYKDNILPGYGKVIITGKGIFSGQNQATFYIDHEHVWDEGQFLDDYSCTGDNIKTFYCTLCGSSKYEVVKGAGHKTHREMTPATLTENGYILETCETCGVYLYDKYILRPETFTLSSKSFAYNGEVRKPTVTVKDLDGNKLVKGTDYDLTYSSGCKNVGKYNVTVKFKGNYSGSKKLSFTIKPKKPTVSKLSALSKGFKLSWKKQTAQVDGFEIRYSLKSSMSGAKTVAVKSRTTTSKSIKSLKAKKTYYVQLRTYKTVDGTKYVSAWTAKKKITTKK